jgi:predicted DNA-binding transcriptional regulator AlpA
MDPTRSDIEIVYDLRVPDVAKRYGRSETWVREMAAAREIPHRRIGRPLEFSSAELDEWDAAHSLRLEDMQAVSA